ncbi:DUF2855 family protein [uncultured Maricaulis sp.]|uniref:DUF2855 family protein n=1 Tax=uncultured Maricaulis sp. TaxID=174710 RepID=UPI0030DC473C|tara:strand:+ start:405 stop:1508 length:1104 start_codon:yes stop_codon:yes gene_type:complete
MNAPITISRLFTDKSDLGRTELREHQQGPLGKGEILLEIKSFSLTTNNITYAAFGDAMQYWNFFPTGEEGFGHMPVWGFADVIASTTPGIAAGERFYGYYPIASHVLMRPGRISPRGFYDVLDHRIDLVSAYNQYSRCSEDPVYRSDREDLQALFRPLFVTAFMLADYLEDNDWFGAQQLLLSSASSKTAYGTAFCLLSEDRVTLAALTSPRNADFVRGLGCYETTTLYDDIETLDASIPTVYVDFAGDAALRARIHHHFGPSLMHDCVVGAAHNAPVSRPVDMPGPAPKFFFAPEQIAKRNKDWGPDAFNARFNDAQEAFFAQLDSAEPAWMTVKTGQGFEAAQAVIRTLAESGGDPAMGHMIELG